MKCAAAIWDCGSNGGHHNSICDNHFSSAIVEHAQEMSFHDQRKSLPEGEKAPFSVNSATSSCDTHWRQTFTLGKGKHSPKKQSWDYQDNPQRESGGRGVGRMNMFIQSKATIGAQHLALYTTQHAPENSWDSKKYRWKICKAPNCQHKQLGNYMNPCLKALQHSLCQWFSTVGDVICTWTNSVLEPLSAHGSALLSVSVIRIPE